MRRRRWGLKCEQGSLLTALRHPAIMDPEVNHV